MLSPMTGSRVWDVVLVLKAILPPVSPKSNVLAKCGQSRVRTGGCHRWGKRSGCGDNYLRAPV